MMWNFAVQHGCLDSRVSYCNDTENFQMLTWEFLKHKRLVSIYWCEPLFRSMKSGVTVKAQTTVCVPSWSSLFQLQRYIVAWKKCLQTTEDSEWKEADKRFCSHDHDLYTNKAYTQCLKQAQDQVLGGRAKPWVITLWATAVACDEEWIKWDAGYIIISYCCWQRVVGKRVSMAYRCYRVRGLMEDYRLSQWYQFILTYCGLLCQVIFCLYTTGLGNTDAGIKMWSGPH